MASRRTRIKGIANIPQRRKTSTNEITYEQIKVALQADSIENVKANLTSEIAHVSENETSAKESLPLPSSIATELPSNNSEKGIEEEVLIDTPPTKGAPEAAAVGSPENDLEKSLHKPVVLVRRKFIKPTVSLNAISRKPKEPEEIKTAPVNQKHLNNNKIIVLNEIITYPDQTQVVIHNQSHEITNPVLEGANKTTNLPQNHFGKVQLNGIERDIKRLVPNNSQTQNSDSEYPAPPPSPSKVNRARIKAVPRLGQRNTSFSASESEDESRRNYRHRNDSVCSSTSGLQDCSSVAECPSPQKPKEFNSVIQRKCRRTEQSRKLAEARRDFMLKFGNKKPDRQKLTMIDLIFYNPTTNPMSHEKKKDDTVVENDQEEPKNEESVDDPNKSGSDEENEIPAPQIKIGPQGEIVVDEQSLVIESKAVKKSREELEKSKVVNGDFDTGYGIYKRAKRSKDWSKHETLKFYKALNTIGTDFALMCELFPRRSRRELKMKFKKEEKINKTLIDRAIMQPCGFDFNDFKQEVDMEEQELLELEKQKEREKELKKEAKKRKAVVPLKTSAEKSVKIAEKPQKKKKKPLDIMNVLDDDSDADESEIESNFDEGEDTTQEKLRQIQQPTRSGRVPKILERYKAPSPEPKLSKPKPGSLIVVTGTGDNGDPVYRVCMVTGGENRQQIGVEKSLSKALEYKQNTCLQSLFTLSASRISEQAVKIEENITIPADGTENLKTISENEAGNG